MAKSIPCRSCSVSCEANPELSFAWLQVDVIEVQYTKLVEAMSIAKNLKAAEAAHEAFLAACVTQNFLDLPMFITVLTRVLSHCKSFCASLKVSAHA